MSVGALLDAGREFLSVSCRSGDHRIQQKDNEEVSLKLSSLGDEKDY